MPTGQRHARSALPLPAALAVREGSRLLIFVAQAASVRSTPQSALLGRLEVSV